MRACAGDSGISHIAVDGIGFLVVSVIEMSSAAFSYEYPKRSCHIFIVLLCSLGEPASSSGSSYAALIAKLSNSSSRSIVIEEVLFVLGFNFES